MAEVRQLSISGIAINQVSCFKHLELEFDGKFNLICGTNGIGKTSILDIIGASFVTYSTLHKIKKNANATGAGGWKIEINSKGNHQIREGEISAFLPDEQTNPFGFSDLAKYLIYLTTNRDFSYTRLINLARDPDKDEGTVQGEAVRGVNSFEIKNWFTNRWLLSPRGADWPYYKKRNLELAEMCFSALDSSVQFDAVDTSTYDIYVKTSYGKVPYEYLSSGFRAALSIMLGIIKEIEFRQIGVSASEFSGVILIDELDLHLHPTWQKAIPFALREIFPEAQFIVSSHSPHMIQVVDANEVIALVRGEDGYPRCADISVSEYGFKGWTIEEILIDVMGLEDTTSDIYREAFRQFDRAIDAEDAPQVEHWLEELNKMLHPTSHIRKLLSIQAASVLGARE